MLRPAVLAARAGRAARSVRAFSATRAAAGASEPTVVHRNTADNNDVQHFDFTAENMKRVKVILDKYPSNYKQSACIPLLDLAQRQNNNFLPISAMEKVAKILEMDPLHVVEVATFYTMFNRKAVGKFFIQLCGTTPCMVCGSEEIKRTIEEVAGIKNGETSKDGLFTLLEVECLGACVNAPMIQINDDFYECLTPETTRDILEACKRGDPPKLLACGSRPMNGQLSCEGPLGQTSLKSQAPDPSTYTRNLEAKVNPRTVAKVMNYEF